MYPAASGEKSPVVMYVARTLANFPRTSQPYSSAAAQAPTLKVPLKVALALKIAGPPPLALDHIALRVPLSREHVNLVRLACIGLL